jgi:hypothetical protein
MTNKEQKKLKWEVLKSDKNSLLYFKTGNFIPSEARPKAERSSGIWLGKEKMDEKKRYDDDATTERFFWPPLIHSRKKFKIRVFSANWCFFFFFCFWERAFWVQNVDICRFNPHGLFTPGQIYIFWDQIFFKLQRIDFKRKKNQDIIVQNKTKTKVDKFAY